MTPAANLHNIKVTDYRVITPARQVDESAGEDEEVVKYNLLQTVAIEYIVKDAQVVHTLTDNQVWEYNREEKTVYRVNPIPEFK